MNNKNIEFLEAICISCKNDQSCIVIDPIEDIYLCAQCASKYSKAHRDQIFFNRNVVAPSGVYTFKASMKPREIRRAVMSIKDSPSRYERFKVWLGFTPKVSYQDIKKKPTQLKDMK